MCNNIREAKVLSIILSLVTVFSVFTFTPTQQNTASAADGGYYKWSGYSTYLQGAGTDADPFLINNPSDLAYFRKQVSATDGTISYYLNNDTTATAKTKDAQDAFYKLTCDIYYNDPNGTEWESWSDTVKPTNGGASAHTWAPSGYGDESTRRFQGCFDGDGHTIFGLYIVHPDKNCVGFIGSFRYGTIKDLTLAKGYVSGKNLVGGFVGQSKVCVELINCNSSLRIKGAVGVGGLIGGNPKDATAPYTDVDVGSEATIASFSMYNCSNSGTVNGTHYVGGLAGIVSSGSARAQIYRSNNSGVISATTNCAGGILGGVNQVDGFGHCHIQHCVNTGKIQGGTGYYTGGIVGCARALEVEYCVNYADVASNGAVYTGGISGGCNSGDGLANGKVKSSFNYGKVTGTQYTGGIIGVAKSTNINMCGNLGDVTGTSCVGGISGRSGGSNDNRDTELYDCYNTGNVVSTDNSTSVAGIIGEAYCEGTVSDNKYVKVKRCINLGTVTGGRAIANTASTLKNSAGTDLFVYQFANTCFALTGVNTSFDGGTGVSSLASSNVLNKLNTDGAWSAGYPYPTLNSIPYELQGRTGIFGTATVSAEKGPALNINYQINTADGYYKALSGFTLDYGVLAIKSDLLGKAELTSSTKGAINCKATLSSNVASALLNNVAADDFDKDFTFRPYALFTAEGQQVYVYGNKVQSSFYSAKGASDVPEISNTAAFSCDKKLFLMAGTTGKINTGITSSGEKESISFISSNPAVATVNGGTVKALKAGASDITVTYTGPWGAKTEHCTVTVMNDLTETVYANQYAEKDAKLRLHTNKLVRVGTTNKNDAFVLDFNGTVMMIDSGNRNDESLKYLEKLRAEFLEDGYKNGLLTEEQYHQRLLSDKCKIQITSLITHWHSDHIYALRYVISQSPRVIINEMYTVKAPAGTDAESYDSYNLAYERMVTAVKTNSPDMVENRFAYETKTVRYIGDNGTVSTSSADGAVKLTMLTAKDWSKVAAMKTYDTGWINSSSSWYLFEYGGNKLLFTGDTYPTDTGSTYTGTVTSGTTAVDYMLYKYASVLDAGVTFLDCNHHARSSFVENIYTVTKPKIVFAGVNYGREDVKATDKAVETASFYLGGDAEQVFVFEADGNIDTSGALCSYSQNDNGRAIRNSLPIIYDTEYAVKTAAEEELTAPTGLTLTSETLWLTLGEKTWLSAIVQGSKTADKNVTWSISDTSVISTDGAYVTAHKTGTATVTVKAGSFTKSCVVNVVVKGDVNKDGIFSSADCISLKMAIIQSIEISDYLVAVGDFSTDGVITAADYSALKLVIKGQN